MYKPVVSNRYLDKKIKEKENELMINKLNGVKAKVNMKCPESFYFYKTQFKKTQMRTNELKEYEMKRNNQILVEKIVDIFANNGEIRKKKPKYLPKNNIFSQTRKWDLYNIAQENQHLLKRLNDRQSFYDTRLWEKNYKKTQIYKQNICCFPSIDFKKTGGSSKRGRLPDIPLNRAKSSSSDYYNKLKTTNFNFSSKRSDGFSNFELSEPKETNMTNKKILFTKNVYLGELFSCDISFYIQDKKFIIEVESKSFGKIYTLIFEDTDEIIKLQNLYSKYEQIIDTLEYNKREEKVIIRSSLDEGFNYTTHSRYKNGDKLEPTPEEENILDEDVNQIPKKKKENSVIMESGEEEIN